MIASAHVPDHEVPTPQHFHDLLTRLAELLEAQGVACFGKATYIVSAPDSARESEGWRRLASRIQLTAGMPA